MRWAGLSVEPRDGRDLETGRVIPTNVTFEFENTTEETMTAAAVILFEDAQGNSLFRLMFDPVRVAAGRERSDRQKVKLLGEVLRDTRKLYLFCEVE